MTKPMRLRDVERVLRVHGARPVREGAEHTIWHCACQQHQTAVPRHRVITAGVVGQIAKDMACHGKGWLQ